VNINDPAFRNLPGWVLAAMANDDDGAMAAPATPAQNPGDARPDFRFGINLETGEVGLMPPAGFDVMWQELCPLS